MSELITRPAPTRVRDEPRTWTQAYIKFLTNPTEHLGLKLLPLAILGLVPIAVADDILLPFLGMADNIPMWVLIGFTVWRTWLRVRRYR